MTPKPLSLQYGSKTLRSPASKLLEQTEITQDTGTAKAFERDSSTLRGTTAAVKWDCTMLKSSTQHKKKSTASLGSVHN